MGSPPNRWRGASLWLMILVASMAASPAARGESLERITVISSPSDSGGEVYYAQERGTFKKYGLDVEIINLTGGAAVSAAMASGKYEIGQGNLASIAAAREAGLPFVLVAPASLYNSEAATSALVVPKDSPIKNAADLTGKSLANPAIKDIGTVALDMWLMQQNVNPASVHVLEMPQAVMSEALTRGTVAGALMIEPYLSASLAQGGRVLVKHYSAVAPRFIIAAYFARSDWAQTHAATVRAFAGAMAETARWANANHAQSAEILAKYLKVPLAANQVRTAYAETLDPVLLQPLIDAAAKTKMIKEPLAATSLLP
jgi:NitT/TauT family transport system substrate-binding protein